MIRAQPPRRDPAACAALILQWQYLPAHIARIMERRGKLGRLSLEEARSAGNLALVRAARRWDQTRGVTFGSYAYKSIWLTIADERLGANVVRVPLHYFRPGDQAAGTSPRGPGPGRPRVNRTMRRQALRAARCGMPESFDPLDRRPSPRLSLELRQALAQLPVRQRLTLHWHYLAGFTFREIAERRGCTKQAVCEQAQEGLRTLRLLLKERD